jgi:hypothetical protein
MCKSYIKSYMQFKTRVRYLAENKVYKLDGILNELNKTRQNIIDTLACCVLVLILT